MTNRPLVPWAVARGMLPLDVMGGEAELSAKLLSGAAQLWPGSRSVGVTEVTEAGRLHIWGAGGDMLELLDMLPDVERFARSAGCPEIEVLGRKGWRRVLSRYGFRREGDAMVKEV